MKYNNFCKNIKKDDVKDVYNDILFSIKKGAFKDEEKERIRSFCRNNINNITYTESEQLIYEYYTNIILKNMHFDGCVDEDDVRVIVQYIALKKLKDMNIKACFRILPSSLYVIKYGLRSVSSCLSMPDGSSIIYLKDSSFKKTLESDKSFNKDGMFWLIDNICHEISHAHQNHIMVNTKEIESKQVLLWIKENLIDSYDPLYYYVNYKNMHIERDADIEGHKMSIDCISKYFNYFGSKFIRQLEYNALDYIRDTKHLQHLSPKTSYKIGADAISIMDDYMDTIAIKHPSVIYQKLSIQYNLDGTRRSSKELCDEYWMKKAKLKKTCLTRTVYDQKLEILNDLYDYLISSAKEKEIYIQYERNKVKRLKCHN